MSAMASPLQATQWLAGSDLSCDGSDFVGGPRSSEIMHSQDVDWRVKNTFIDLPAGVPTLQEKSMLMARSFSAPALPVCAEAPAPEPENNQDGLHPGYTVLGSDALPTVGSAMHHASRCKPCAFMRKKEGCNNGVNCAFCHLCEEGEKKRRKKEKKERRRVANTFWNELYTTYTGGAPNQHTVLLQSTDLPRVWGLSPPWHAL